MISFERVIYFGYIQEQHKDPKLLAEVEKTPKKKAPRDIAFGSKVKDPSRIPKLPGIQAAQEDNSRDHGDNFDEYG